MNVADNITLNPKIANSEDELAKYIVRAVNFNAGKGYVLPCFSQENEMIDEWLKENAEEAYIFEYNYKRPAHNYITIRFQSETDAIFYKMAWSE